MGSGKIYVLETGGFVEMEVQIGEGILITEKFLALGNSETLKAGLGIKVVKEETL